MPQTRRFCTFFLDNLLFGVELQGVQEVLGPLEVTRLPLAPPMVAGLVNLRGQIITAVDLRRQLEFRERGEGEPAMNVVVPSEDGAVSLRVDAIGDVIEVDHSSFERPPETLHGRVRSMILGVHKLEHRLLHVLDLARACQIGEESVAQKG